MPCRHPGDWGNLKVKEDGSVMTSFNDTDASLFGPQTLLGRGIVVRHICTCVCARAHTHTYIHTHNRACLNTQTLNNSHYTNKHIHTHTHTHTHTHARAHRHIHTHTHTYNITIYYCHYSVLQPTNQPTDKANRQINQTIRPK